MHIVFALAEALEMDASELVRTAEEDEKKTTNRHSPLNRQILPFIILRYEHILLDCH